MADKVTGYIINGKRYNAEDSNASSARFSEFAKDFQEAQRTGGQIYNLTDTGSMYGGNGKSYAYNAPESIKYNPTVNNGGISSTVDNTNTGTGTGTGTGTETGTTKRDVLGEIEKLRQARMASRNAALTDVLNKTKSSLSAEKATIAPQYYDLKNNESSTAQLRAKKLGEIMADKGYSTGLQGQAELANNIAYRGNLGLLNRQEQSAYDDIARRGTLADQEYQTGVAQANADIDTWAAEQKLAELGTLRNYDREDARNSVLDQRYNTEYADSRSDTTFNQDLQTKQFNAQQEQQDLDNQYRQGTFDWQKQNDLWEQQYKQGTFNYQKERDSAADKQWSKEYQLKLREFVYQKSQQLWDNSFQQKQFDYQKEQDKINNSQEDNQFKQEMKLKLDEFTWSKSKDNPAVQAQILSNKAQSLQNQALALQNKYLPEKERAELAKIYADIKATQDNSASSAQVKYYSMLTKQAELQQLQDKIANDPVNKAVDNYSKAIDSQYVTTQTVDNGINKSQTYKYDTKSIAAFIKNLDDSLPDNNENEAIIDGLLLKYGLPTGK